ncbi:MAG: hypothetical protein NT027_09370 [Proteobacteria bacterium]|nr:hypothetical protein [Pseudomonadota bacterium]
MSRKKVLFILSIAIVVSTLSSCRSSLNATLKNTEKKCRSGSTSKSAACEVASKSTDVVSVTSVSATTADGSYKAGDVLSLTVAFSDVVNVTGKPTLTLVSVVDDKTESSAEYASGSGSSTLTFSYTVKSTDRSTRLDYAASTSLKLNSGSIVDKAGLAVTLTLPTPGSTGSLGYSKKLVLDNDRPWISNIESLALKPGESTPAIAFKIEDATSTLTCSSAHLSMTSSDTALVLNSSVTWSGTYPNCTTVINAQPVNQGTAMITITLRDSAGFTTSVDFPLFVSNAYVYGKTTMTLDKSFYESPGYRDAIMVNGRLYIGGGYKISVWNTFPETGNQLPDFVLGSFSRNSSYLTNRLDELSIGVAVTSMATDGKNLIVTDGWNHRILIWNKAPASPRELPDLVLGQSDFVGKSSNRGASANAGTLATPQGVALIGQKLVVSDSSNNRVLIWNKMPTLSGTPADVVIGQPDFTTTSTGLTSMKFSSPASLTSDGTNLVVLDRFNRRVLIWNSVPQVSNSPADLVIGQTDFTSNTAAITASGFDTWSSLQGGIAYYGTKLLVGNKGRILVWNSTPTVSGQSADSVLGQSNMTTMTYGQNTNWSFDSISNINIVGGRLIVGDPNLFGTSRTLIWNSVPQSYNTPSDIIFSSFSTPAVADWHPKASTKFISSGTKMFATDTNRVLIWNAIPTSVNTPPDIVLGQPDFSTTTANNGGRSASSLSNPQDIIVVGTKLIVSEFDNNRVLIWNNIPTASNQNADVVIGQPNFTGLTSVVPLDAAKLWQPSGLASDGTKLIIADSGNYRVLIYNTIPTVNGTSANVVVGQANMTTNAYAGSQTRFNANKVSLIGGNLAVVDGSRNRVLLWSGVPTSNDAAANIVLGQPDFTSNTSNSGGLSASSLFGPSNIFQYGSKVVVSDANNRRLLVWNSVPTSTFQSADSVLFQSSFTSNSSGFGRSPFGVVGITFVSVISGKLYVGEYSDRVLVTDNPLD